MKIKSFLSIIISLITVILFTGCGGGSRGRKGSCTYNPHNKNIDLMMIFMMIVSLLYPLRREYIK